MSVFQVHSPSLTSIQEDNNYLNSLQRNFPVKPPKIGDKIPKTPVPTGRTSRRSSAIKAAERLLEAATKKKRLISKIVWITVVIACVLGCLIQVFTFLEIFWKFPTIIDIETERTDKLEFPAITLCNNNRVRLTQWCLLKNIPPDQCKQNQESEIDFTDFERKLSVMPLNERFKLGHQKYPMIFETKKIVNGTNEVNDDQGFRNQFFHIKYSNCFSYNVEWTGSGVRDPEKARQIDFSTVLFLEQKEYLKEKEWPGGQAVFHHPESIPDPSEDGIPLRAGHNYIFTLRMMITRRLKWPFWTDCVDYEFENRHPYTIRFTRPLCEKECAYNASLEMCRCIRRDVALPYEVPWDRDPSGKRRFCDDDIGLSRCWIKVLDKTELCQKKHCKLSCWEYQYETSVTQDPWPDELFFREEIDKYASINISSFHEARKNLTRIYIIFGTLNRLTYRHRAKYEPIELFSYMGGFIGIWIGVSFLNVLDYLTVATNWLITKCHERRVSAKQEDKHSDIQSEKGEDITKSPPEYFRNA